MINNVTLVGRLTKAPELRKNTKNMSVCQFTLAVDRNKEEADFITCVAFKQSADYLTQYGSKGATVALNGRIRTRSYDGQNGKVYVTEVVANEVNLIGKTEHKEVEAPFPDVEPPKNEIVIDAEELPFY